MNFEFIREKKNNQLLSVKEIYDLELVFIKNDIFCLSDSFKKLLQNKIFTNFLLDSTKYSISIYDDLFTPENWQNGFILYNKYSRKDVFRILNSRENPVAQNVGGYLVSQDNSNCPIFVNYHKEDHISESTKYEDEFVNTREFDWMSKSNRKINSNDVQSILGKNGEIRLPLFIKKSNDEGTDFYYMGEMKPNLNLVTETSMNNNNGSKVSVVKIRFNVSPPVVDSLYDYINDNSAETHVIHEESKVEVSHQLKIETKHENLQTIPLYNFYAAAGSFSELQSDNEFTLINAPTFIRDTKDYFACKIIGESMNRVIPNGSIALFRFYSGGSRNGKIVLVENRDIQDSDFNSAFTVKTYTSEKIVTEEGWTHTRIQLLPHSFDESYLPINIDEENGEKMKIIGEFVTILQ